MLSQPTDHDHVHGPHVVGLSVDGPVKVVFLCCVLQGPRLERQQELIGCMEENQIWLNKQKKKAFYTAVAAESFREGAQSLLQVPQLQLIQLIHII